MLNADVKKQMRVPQRASSGINKFHAMLGKRFVLPIMEAIEARVIREFGAAIDTERLRNAIRCAGEGTGNSPRVPRKQKKTAYLIFYHENHPLVLKTLQTSSHAKPAQRDVFVELGRLWRELKANGGHQKYVDAALKLREAERDRAEADAVGSADIKTAEPATVVRRRKPKNDLRVVATAFTTALDDAWDAVLPIVK